MSKYFQPAAWPGGVKGVLWLDGGTFPVQFSLNPESVVVVTCAGEVDVEVSGMGGLKAQPGASMSFRTDQLGIQVEMQTAQLILEAADAQGIPVEHRCTGHRNRS